MEYTPTDIEIVREGFFGGNITASFKLINKHTVICRGGYSSNYRLYVDGKEIQHGLSVECRFQIEGVDCFVHRGVWGVRLEVGGFKVF